MKRRHYAITLQEASEDSPVLGRLIALAHQSSERLRTVLPLIPVGLHASVQAGPIEGPTWCLLVKNNATAAKMRQLLPALQAHLCKQGSDVTSIRLKIQAPSSPH